ncbi:MAG: hypothetical protein JKY31_04330, partial [Rhodobacteraceae bacterium]|nr:hypothetical protein [Paracoccaceae bacterium]
MSFDDALQSLSHTRSRLWAFFTDKVVLGCFLIVLAQLVIDPATVPESLRFLLAAVLSMAPFFLIAVGLAAYFAASGADGYIAKAFSGSPTSAIVG